MAGEVPDSRPALIEAIAVQRRRVREGVRAAKREVEARGDRELALLDRAEAALEALGMSGSDDAPREEPAGRGGRSKKASRGRAKTKRRRRTRAATTPDAVRERCELVFRYLAERDEAVLRGDVCRALEMTPHVVKTALMLLCREGRVVRTGTGPSTRYRAKRGGSSGSGAVLPMRRPQGGTLEGRVLAIVEDRGFASLDELVQATGELRDRVLKACGALIREDELRMARRDGRPVYVRVGRAAA